ncbi:MAG: hypothetical protein ACK5HT_09880 [Draconibacterium sp.]
MDTYIDRRHHRFDNGHLQGDGPQRRNRGWGLFWDGFAGGHKGGLVGAVGGALGMVGGETFVAQLAIGTGSGAVTGGLDAALWENDIGEGMLYGAAAGAAFTTLTSENFSNWTKGKGFYNNGNVFENFKNGKYAIPQGSTWQQEALGHFGFEGTYDPDNNLFGGGPDPGVTDPVSGEIFYNERAFSGKYDDLEFTYDHEMWHRQRVLSGNFVGSGITKEIKYREEFTNYIRNYKRQGLYPNHTFHDLGWRINANGSALGINPDIFMRYTGLDKTPWWHFIFKISRKW